MFDRTVRDLAGALIDGEVIDWPAAQARLTSSLDHSVAEELRTLSRLRTHRRDPANRRTSRRLSALLEGVRWLAAVRCAAGLLGTIVAMQSIEVARIGVIAVALIVFAVTAAMLDTGAADRRTRALAACHWTIAASFASGGVRWIAQTRPEMRWLQVFAAMYPECFFPACLWQFARDFPSITRFGLLDRVCVGARRFVIGLGIALFVINLLAGVAPATWSIPWAATLQRMTRGSWFWTLVFGAAIPALAVIAWRGRSAVGKETARVRFFLYGVTVSIAPIVIEVFAEGLFPSFRTLARTPQWRAIGAWLLYPPLFVLPALTAYAIAVDNVLDFRVAIQRGLRYLLARWLIMWGAAVPLGLLIAYLYRHSSRPLAEILTDRQAHVLMLVDVAAIVALAFRRTLVHLLDRWILPGADDPSSVLVQMTERMKQTRTPLEIAVVFARASERALQAPGHAYLMHHGELVPASEGTMPLPPHSLVPVLTEGSREPCVVSARHGHSYYPLVTDDDRAWIDQHRIAVVVPIVSGRRGSGLLGIVALNDRRNALAFSQDDLRFLRAGAAAASLATDLVTSGGTQTPLTGNADEVAAQCVNCGRIEPWENVNRPCTCRDRRWEPAAVPAQLLGRFDVTRKLGSGGMGVVYGAVDVHLGREVALKTLTRLSEGAASRLRREARAMAALTHPNIGVVYNVDVWCGTPLLVMEYLAGGTLSARLRRGPLPIRDAVLIVQQLVSALEQVHRAGQYHGDIKPSNIGFTSQGTPKFLDFGLSRAMLDDGDKAARQRPSGPIAGTPAYMSPEAHEGAPGDVALDIWALCVVLYESVTGVNPFLHVLSAADITIASRDIKRRLPPSAAVALGPLIEDAFAPRPRRSLQTAAALALALAAINVE